MKSTVLITGGAGYVGSHTAYLMAQKGYEVIILDTFLHNQQFDPHWATLIKKDFANKPTLKKIFTNHRIKAVIHFAAFIEVGKSVKDPLCFYQNNVVKTIALLESMIKYGVKNIIFSSSCAVYGIPQYLPLNEQHPKKPISPYGKNKLIIEMALEDFSKAYGLNYVSLRYFNAAGAMPQYGLGEQHEPETHIIPLIFRAAARKKPFSVFGGDYQTKDGSCIRDYVHVWDLAQAHWLAYEYLKNKNSSDCLNLGTGKGFSVKQLIETTQQKCKITIETVFTQKRPGDPPILIADPSKAKNKLGWEPRYGLEEIITSAYAFENRKRELKNQKSINFDQSEISR